MKNAAFLFFTHSLPPALIISGVSHLLREFINQIVALVSSFRTQEIIFQVNNRYNISFRPDPIVFIIYQFCMLTHAIGTVTVDADITTTDNKT